MENAKDMTRSTQAVSVAVVTNKPLDGLVLEETVSGDSSTDCQATTHEELPKEADIREVTALAKNKAKKKKIPVGIAPIVKEEDAKAEMVMETTGRSDSEFVAEASASARKDSTVQQVTITD